MNKLVVILVLLQLHAFNTLAQDSLSIPKESIPLTQLELKTKHLDSMVRQTRKQFYNNNYDLTIQLGDELMPLANEINNKKAIFSLSSLMGNAFLKLDDTLQAKRIFSNSIARAEKLHDTTRTIITARIDLGNYYALQHIYTQAIKLYKQALPLTKRLKDTTHLYILNYNIAESLLEQKKVSEADYYVAEMNKYVKALKPDAYHAGAYLLTGKLNFAEGKLGLALENLKNSIVLSESAGFKDGLIQGHEFLAKSYEKSGDYAAAYSQMQIVDGYKSDKYKTDKIEAVETVTAKFKLNQYQQEIKAQALQNEYNKVAAKRETTALWIKIASAILLVSSFILFLSYRKRKKLLKNLIVTNQHYLEEKEKSEELAKARSILFSNITHELRTPMYGIIGISSIMMKDKKLKAHKENLWSLKFSANQLLSLINNVLQFTSIDGVKKGGLGRNKLDIRDMVANIVHSSRFINVQHPSDYCIEIDERIPRYLIGDETKLSQVLINLIGNAAKFTNDGVITIKIDFLEMSNSQVNLLFTIKDTGIGIPPAKQSQLFDAFSNSTNDDTYAGVGLGLPIVNKILKLYDSDIQLNSEHGKGTEISFSLSLEKAPEVNNSAVQVKELPSDALKNKNILVVEDNKINLLVTKKTLVLQGASVDEAADGSVAVAKAKLKGYDLILMDINMPIMNGFEATKAIRKFDPDVPIVALTAVELEKVIGDNSSNLMNDFIIKPYKKEAFLHIILKHTKAEELV